MMNAKSAFSACTQLSQQGFLDYDRISVWLQQPMDKNIRSE
jgi:hypothetical protein